MHDSKLMSVREGATDAAHYLFGLMKRDSLAGNLHQHVRERLAFKPFHHNEVKAAVVVEIEDAYNIGMVELRQLQEFLPEVIRCR